MQISLIKNLLVCTQAFKEQNQKSIHLPHVVVSDSSGLQF